MDKKVKERNEEGMINKTSEEDRVCEICGVSDSKESMWNMNYGYYLCDECYWEKDMAEG